MPQTTPQDTPQRTSQPKLQRALAIWVALVALAAVAGAAAPAQAGPKHDAWPRVGRRAPTFALPVLNAEQAGIERFSVRRLVGRHPKTPKRALVVVFSASWCGPCREEMPQVKALEARFREQGVAVVLVSLDRERAEIDQMREWVVDELRLPFPVVVDRRGRVDRLYRVEYLPKSVLIDAQGRVRYVHEGYAEGDVDALARQVAALLAEQPRR